MLDATVFALKRNIIERHNGFVQKPSMPKFLHEEAGIAFSASDRIGALFGSDFPGTISIDSRLIHEITNYNADRTLDDDPNIVVLSLKGSICDNGLLGSAFVEAEISRPCAKSASRPHGGPWHYKQCSESYSESIGHLRLGEL